MDNYTLDWRTAAAVMDRPRGTQQKPETLMPSLKTQTGQQVRAVGTKSSSVPNEKRALDSGQLRRRTAQVHPSGAADDITPIAGAAAAVHAASTLGKRAAKSTQSREIQASIKQIVICESAAGNGFRRRTTLLLAPSPRPLAC